MSTPPFVRVKSSKTCPWPCLTLSQMSFFCHKLIINIFLKSRVCNEFPFFFLLLVFLQQTSPKNVVFLGTKMLIVGKHPTVFSLHHVIPMGNSVRSFLSIGIFQGTKCHPFQENKAWKFGGWAPRTDGYVVNNHGLVSKSPKDRVVGPLPNGLNCLYMGVILTTYPSPGMILQVEVRRFLRDKLMIS